VAIIKFNNTGVPLKLDKKRDLKRFLASIFVQEGVWLRRLEYIFCDDDYLLALNRTYLGHDTYTDIITFTLSEPLAPVTAEIYISTERVFENARSLGEADYQELRRVMIHGVLHLCGLGDKTPAAKKVMSAREDHYLAAYVSRET